jgi:hypothetical protein
MLTGVVPEPDRQIQQERWGRANTKALIDLMADFYPLLQRPEMSRPTPTDAEYWEKHKKLKKQAQLRTQLVLVTTEVLSARIGIVQPFALLELVRGKAMMNTLSKCLIMSCFV